MNTNVAVEAPAEPTEEAQAEQSVTTPAELGPETPADAPETREAEPTAETAELAVAQKAPPPPVPAASMPEPRAAADPEADPAGGKAKKARKAVRGRTAGGTKSLVVWHQGRVHYADDSVLVIDLDEASSADLDVHDLVDRLSELREAVDSAGRTEAVTALVEIIQDKALN